MPDEPAPRDYERAPTRVRVASGKPWLAIWGAAAAAVVAIGIAGTLMAPRPDDRTTGIVAEAAIPTPTPPPVTPGTTPPVAGPAASDSAGPIPLVVESTDFYANSGPAYYGIGGKLIRSLAPVPTRTPNPGDAPD